MTGSNGDKGAFASLADFATLQAEDGERSRPARGGASDLDERHHRSLPHTGDRCAPRDGLGGPEVGSDILRGRQRQHSVFAFGRQVKNNMTTHAVASWASPTPRLWQIICGGRLAPIQRAVVQGYVGSMVTISTGAHGTLERWTTSTFWPSHRASGQVSTIHWHDT